MEIAVTKRLCRSHIRGGLYIPLKYRNRVLPLGANHVVSEALCERCRTHNFRAAIHKNGKSTKLNITSSWTAIPRELQLQAGDVLKMYTKEKRGFRIACRTLGSLS